MQPFDSDSAIIIESGFVYFPLLVDPSVDEEIGTTSGLEPSHKEPHLSPQVRKPRSLIRINGKYFIRSMSLNSILEYLPDFFPVSYQRLKTNYFKEYLEFAQQSDGFTNTTVETIIFRIMPHFVRRRNKLGKGQFTTEDILDIVAENNPIPENFYRVAARLLDVDEFKRRLALLEKHPPMNPPEDGLIPARRLGEWLHSTLIRRIIREEKEHLERLLRERGRLIESQMKYVATLLYLSEKGSFERDGFGFYKADSSDGYIVYKRTGEYALKDFFGRIYLFPDCRVGISTLGYIKPMVLDRYKHPFLESDEPGQEICVGTDAGRSRHFSAENVIDALEEGIGALFYGYNSRRRNGYHSLDPSTVHFRTLNFDDYRVPKDHPKIASGDVEIKNAFK